MKIGICSDIHLHRHDQHSEIIKTIDYINSFNNLDLFVFAGTRQENGKDGNSGRDGGTSTFTETLQPVINHIITDAHPQLLAAMIHLQSEFSHAVDEMRHPGGKKDSENS